MDWWVPLAWTLLIGGVLFLIARKVWKYFKLYAFGSLEERLAIYISDPRIAKHVRNLFEMECRTLEKVVSRLSVLPCLDRKTLGQIRETTRAYRWYVSLTENPDMDDETRNFILQLDKEHRTSCETVENELARLLD